MARYYLSRLGIAIAFGWLWFLVGATWWIALLVGLSAFAWFLWAPHSGRYSVHPELGVTALRRDERTQRINDQAARNGFVVTMLALAGLLIYSQGMSLAMPVNLGWILILGALAYFISDWILRRST